jgi:hypothetical protein
MAAKKTTITHAPYDLPNALNIEPAADQENDGHPHPTPTTRPDEDPTTR